MTDTSVCPSVADLDRLARGDAVDAGVARHVDGCAACLEQIGEFRANNTIAGELAGMSIEASPGSAEPPLARHDEPPSFRRMGYRVTRELSRGGQGVVYLAEHAPTARRVAIKTLLLGARATFRQRARFEREAELLAGITHPGIVTVYDSGITAEGQAYLVMEFIEGQPLDAWIADGGRRKPRRERLALFVMLCDAVDAAHVRGVIHRDLKPSNILIDKEDRPHVLDFGVARATEGTAGDEATRTGDFVGTLAYAAPEQLERDPERIDTRTDVYALGLIMYELLTGVRARPAGLSFAELTRLAGRAPVKPSAHTRSVDDDLDTITLKALEPSGERRYRSVAALRDDVGRYLEGRAIDAKRGRRWYAARKFVACHRAPIAGVLVLVGVLAGATAVSLALLRDSRTEAAKANSIRVFLEDTLGSVQPDPEGGDPTIADVLDEAVHWIEIALSDEPEIAASLHDTIGNSYRVLQRLDAAEIQLATAMAIRKDLFGETHPEFAVSLNRMAMLLADQHRTDEAEILAREALEIRERAHGADSEPVVSSMMNLGSILLLSGRPEEAVAAYERALSIRRRLQGETTPDVAMCVYRLAEATAAIDPAEAAGLHAEALATRRATLPLNHPDLIRSLEAVAEARIKAGISGSVPFAAELVERHRAAHGSSSWRTSRAMLVLARALFNEGNNAGALAAAKSAGDGFRQALGPAHPYTLQARDLAEELRAVVELP